MHSAKFSEDALNFSLQTKYRHVLPHTAVSNTRADRSWYVADKLHSHTLSHEKWHLNLSFSETMAKASPCFK